MYSYEFYNTQYFVLNRAITGVNVGDSGVCSFSRVEGIAYHKSESWGLNSGMYE